MKRVIATGLLFAAVASAAADELPIMGYSGFPSTAANLEMRYREAKECGLTALMQGFGNEAQVRKCLDTAQRVGIKLLLANRKLFEADGSQLSSAAIDSK